MKIVYCTNSLGTRGGIERVTIIKANALAEMDTNEVYIVFTDAKGFPETIHPLSPKVKVVDLNVGHWNDHYTSFWQRLFVPKWKMLKHYVRLQSFVSEVRPDIMISVGQCEKYILPILRHAKVLIREVHFNSTYRFDTYGQGWLNQFKAKMLHFVDFYLLCRVGYSRTYLLTEEDKLENFKDASYIGYMHNPSTFTIDSQANAITKRENVVLAVGRLNYQKNFPSLLRIWASICKEYPDWILRIVGEGPQKRELEEIILELNIGDSVDLVGYSSKVDEYMRAASIFTLTSMFEGFALVLVEAMACRLPVVSYETHYGPKDIVIDNVSGFLVRQNDETMFAQRLKLLIENLTLREKMAREAELRAEDFRVDKIAAKWMKEFNYLMDIR